MNWLEEARGFRTLLAGLIGMLCLVIGFKLLAVEQRGAAFVFFAGGIGAIVSALVVKSIGTSAVNGEGITQGWKNLMTPAKPGETPPPQPPAPPTGG